MKTLKQKLTSRKFLLTVACFIAGIAAVITGLNTDNQGLLIVGAICSALATMIYNICEVYYDVAAAEETTVVEEVEFEDDDDDTDEVEYEDVD